MRQAMIATAIEDDLRYPRLDLTFESIPQTASVFVAFSDFASCQFSSHAEPNQIRHRFSAGAPLAFLMTADLLWRHADAASDKKCACSFGPVNFVRGQERRV